MKILEGQVWTFRDHVDTDVIIPGRYLRILDLDEMSSHVMEGEDPDFASQVKNGDIIVAGVNFGCGSSREQAPVALKHLGVAAVVAPSFARIFYRNAINVGLPVIMADVEAEKGDILSIDLEAGIILNKSNGKKFEIQPFQNFMLEILEDGGLVNHFLKNRGNS
ncbi:MAG TPA: homoaconitase small subunit [Methanobacteriaceae archaeon]|jgi:methanogen homoaconitase small subunit|nr:homoaconitase small subunit [Euryarchaeota archaeon]HNR25147.1 homoaconitase small subunit [Methanobacteriaceae archaeon]HNS25339.1 homoaconitase small subunit [Methanobacteriaceae archaeon]